MVDVPSTIVEKGATTPPRPAPPAPVVVDAVERAALLTIARLALGVAVGAAEASELDAAIGAHAAAVGTPRWAPVFVTLTRTLDGSLRGCMGILDVSEPVGATVASAAVSAALGDPRFEPVTRSELADLTVGISVLGPFVPLADPQGFRLGTDGLLVERAGQRGLLLPEVAGKLGFDRAAMLAESCRNAGLAPGAWRDAGTLVRAFRTCRFSGPAAPSGSG